MPSLKPSIPRRPVKSRAAKRSVRLSRAISASGFSGGRERRRAGAGAPSGSGVVRWVCSEMMKRFLLFLLSMVSGLLDLMSPGLEGALWAVDRRFRWEPLLISGNFGIAGSSPGFQHERTPTRILAPPG